MRATVCRWTYDHRMRELVREEHDPGPRYPRGPASPNEYWPIDVTVIRLVDGTRTYLDAVIVNFRRRITAWKIALRLEPQTTCEILAEAANGLPSDGEAAKVVAASGVENVSNEVDALLGLGQLRCVLAR